METNKCSHKKIFKINKNQVFLYKGMLTQIIPKKN